MQTVRCLLFLSLSVALPLSGIPAHAQQASPTPTPSAPPAPTAASLVKEGIANGLKGDLNLAIESFSKAIELDPKYAPAYENRGKALFMENRNDDALAEYDRALQLDPNYGDAYYDRGVVRAIKGDFDGAIDDFSHAITLNPKRVMAYYNRGHTKYFKADLTGASKDLELSLELAPNFPYNYFIRGLIRRANGDLPGATSDFRRASEGTLSDSALWLWVVQSEQHQGAVNQELTEFVAKFPQNPESEWNAKLADLLMGKIKSDVLLDQARLGDPSDDRLAKTYFFTGILQRLSGDLTDAQASFHQALATSPKSSEIYIEAQRELAKMPK